MGVGARAHAQTSLVRALVVRQAVRAAAFLINLLVWLTMQRRFRLLTQNIGSMYFLPFLAL